MSPLVDWHTHVWSLEDDLTDRAERQLNRIGEMNLEAGPERHRREVAARVDGAVLVGAHWPRVGITVPNRTLADYLDTTDVPTRALASIDPSRPGAGPEAERAVRDRGFHGFKLAPTYQGFHPWDETAREVYEVAVALGVPVMFHQGAAFAAESSLDEAKPYLLDRVAREHPELRIIVAHFGQPWIEETIQLMRKHPTVLADLSARYIRSWQLFHGLTIAVEYGVQDRLLFGSDFPTQTTADALASFRAAADRLVGSPFPLEVGDAVEQIINDRPLELVWPSGHPDPEERPGG